MDLTKREVLFLQLLIQNRASENFIAFVEVSKDVKEGRLAESSLHALTERTTKEASLMKYLSRKLEAYHLGE